MPNNHSKFGIPRGLRIGGTPVGFHRDHCGPGIHPPAAFGGETLDFHAAAGEEGVDGVARVLRFDPGKDNPPVRRLQPEVGEGCRTLDHVDHIYPVRQGRIEPVPYVGCGVKPAEWATGNPARRTPRSTARAISLWLAKRILPLLAYRTISRAVMGSTRTELGAREVAGAGGVPGAGEVAGAEEVAGVREVAGAGGVAGAGR